ncbi:substrate-binding domain-containing protein [Streptosporangiaceae bacterium NEAU-GS5]|nr:substrate-binding domain-containing protein [Streptosporangiaceae bacterium NEAU-GS5]
MGRRGHRRPEGAASAAALRPGRRHGRHAVQGPRHPPAARADERGRALQAARAAQRRPRPPPVRAGRHHRLPAHGPHGLRHGRAAGDRLHRLRPGLTLDQIRRIYRGDVVNWKDLGGPDLPVRLVSRDANSGTRDLFRRRILDGPGEPAFTSRDCVDKNAPQDVVRGGGQDVLKAFGHLPCYTPDGLKRCRS